FFQAEDGIRDRNVTGVQTCALPISHHESFWSVPQKDSFLIALPVHSLQSHGGIYYRPMPWSLLRWWPRFTPNGGAPLIPRPGRDRERRITSSRSSLNVLWSSRSIRAWERSNCARWYCPSTSW